MLLLIRTSLSNLSLLNAQLLKLAKISLSCQPKCQIKKDLQMHRIKLNPEISRGTLGQETRMTT